MKVKDSLKLVHSHVRRYYPILLLLACLNLIPGILLAVRPVVLAPVLGKVVSDGAQPAKGWHDLTLDNIGPTLLKVMGASGDDAVGGMFVAAAGAYFLLTLLAAAGMAVVSAGALRVRLRIFGDMVDSLHGHMLGLDVDYFGKHKGGELVNRFNLDLARASNSVDTVVIRLIQATVQIMVCGYLLLKTDALLTVLILVLGLIHIGITKAMSGWVRRSAAASSSGQAELTAALTESFSHVQVTKIFAVESYEKNRIREAVDHVRDTFFRFMMTRYMELPIRLVTDGLIVGSVLALCHYSISTERLTLAGTAIFFYMAVQLVQPMSELSKQVLFLHGLRANTEALLRIFSEKSRVKSGTKTDCNKLEQSISLDHVTFAYSSDKIVLEDVSLDVKRGETLALVGPSGSGKTTLVNLVLKLYEPNSGRILLDGRDVRDFDLHTFRRMFGVVGQECLLYHASIRENLLLGREASDDLLDRACRIANIKDFIDELPQGLDTVVGERGVRLSGGQRQRVAIARAVYSMPTVLVLDEATSSLDAESESLVQEAIEKALEGLTGIVIAHRLSTVARATRTVVLNGSGGIEAIGNHSELMASSPTYERLYSLQFAGNEHRKDDM